MIKTGAFEKQGCPYCGSSEVIPKDGSSQCLNCKKKIDEES